MALSGVRESLVAYKACLDCGSKMYQGACPYCHEHIFSENEYHQEEMEVPEELAKKADEERKEVDVLESAYHDEK